MCNMLYSRIAFSLLRFFHFRLSASCGSLPHQQCEFTVSIWYVLIWYLWYNENDLCTPHEWSQFTASIYGRAGGSSTRDIRLYIRYFWLVLDRGIKTVCGLCRKYGHLTQAVWVFVWFYGLQISCTNYNKARADTEKVEKKINAGFYIANLVDKREFVSYFLCENPWKFSSYKNYI